MTKRFWSCALMTLVSAGVSAGFSLNGLLGSGQSDSFARYAASRSVALLLTVLIAICGRSYSGIAFLGITATIMQAFDGVIGALAHDPSKTYGPLLLLSSTQSRWVGSFGDSRGKCLVVSANLLCKSASLRCLPTPIRFGRSWSPRFARRRRTLCRQIYRARTRLRIGSVLSTRSMPLLRTLRSLEPIFCGLISKGVVPT